MPELKTGRYKSSMWDCPYDIHVHWIHEGRVCFSRRELPGLSVSPIASFLGIVVIPDR